MQLETAWLIAVAGATSVVALSSAEELAGFRKLYSPTGLMPPRAIARGHPSWARSIVESTRAHRALLWTRVALCTTLLSLVFLTGAGPVRAFLAGAVALTMLGTNWRNVGLSGEGSDQVTLIVLISYAAYEAIPETSSSKGVPGLFVGAQIAFSYFASGLAKVVEKTWRNGDALRGVFSVSEYRVERLRSLPRGHLALLAWALMLFELLFPLALLNEVTTLIALAAAAGLHISAAWILGLNRFVLAFISTYPLVWNLSEAIRATTGIT